MTEKNQPFGALALAFVGKRLPLQLLKSNAGFYIGTADGDMAGPCSRESEEYFRSYETAQYALKTGRWTQRMHP